MAARVVTISATYGAGGSLIGPAVAERLQLPFLDRAIPAAVAETLDVPLAEVLAREERRPGLLARMLAALSAGDVAIGAQPVPEPSGPSTEDAFQASTEEVLRTAASTGAVILGRAGALILATEPHALHVRLDGPAARRVVAVARREREAEDVVRRRLEDTDRARLDYVRHFYRADARHAHHYHLVIDTTWLGADLAVDLIVQAANAVA